MDPRYAKTFSQHRILFTLPVLLATALALWAVVTAPAAYVSKSTLWFDTPPTDPSSLAETNTALLTPAAQAQQLLAELLATRQFRLTVGRTSPLGRYLKQHPVSTSSPAGLLTRLRGGESVTDRLVSALGTANVGMAIPGPQVLALSFQGPDPAVTRATLQALITEFNGERGDLGVARLESTVAFYRSQASAASSALAAAKQKLATTANDVNAHRDAALQKATAASRLSKATKALNQALLTLAATRSDAEHFQVIDAPSLPLGPTSHHKKQLFAVLAGLFAGGVVSFFGIAMLTALQGRRSRDAEQATLVAVVTEPAAKKPAARRANTSADGTAAPRKRTTKPSNGTTSATRTRKSRAAGAGAKPTRAAAEEEEEDDPTAASWALVKQALVTGAVELVDRESSNGHASVNGDEPGPADQGESTGSSAGGRSAA
jgi:hypothetical protein